MTGEGRVIVSDKSVAIDPEFNVTLDTLLIARDTKLTALGRDTFATIITS